MIGNQPPTDQRAAARMGTMDALVFAARAAMLALERQHAATLATRYARLGAQLADLTAALATAIADAGPAADAAWLDQQALYQRLVRGATVQSRQLGRSSEALLLAQGRTMIRRAATDSRALLRAAGMATPAALADAAMQQLVDDQARRVASYDLPQLLPQLAIAAVRAAVARAARFRQTAAAVADGVRAGLGKVLTRLLFLSRHEAVTPYRDTAHVVFATNGVAQWQWFAEIELRPPPCGMCVALHGRLFPMDAAFATHLGCRCLPVPVLAAPPVTLGGRTWFDGQDAATRKAVLGASKLRHYEAGALRLDDLISDDLLPDGRAARRERSLQDLGLDRVRPARKDSSA